MTYPEATQKRRIKFYEVCRALIEREHAAWTHQMVLDFMHGLAIVDDNCGWSVP